MSLVGSIRSRDERSGSFSCNHSVFVETIDYRGLHLVCGEMQVEVAPVQLRRRATMATAASMGPVQQVRYQT